MASSSRESIKTSSEDGSANAWAEMAKQAMKENAERWGEKVEPPTWEEMSEADKVTSLAEDVNTFLSRHDSRAQRKFSGEGGFFSNSALGSELDYPTRRKQMIEHAGTQWANGQGYKDISALEKIAAKNPNLQEEVGLLAEHIREVDAHHGLTPKEYEQQQNKTAE